jgi:hypothetical protein
LLETAVNMKRIFTSGLAAATMCLSLTTVTAQGQEPGVEPPPSLSAADEAWSYRNPPQREAKPTLAQERAIVRGQQRAARLEAMRWYGFSGSRPTASGIPFTTMYSPAWQQPGGRPFAWYTSSRPIIIYTPDHAVYR